MTSPELFERIRFFLCGPKKTKYKLTIFESYVEKCIVCVIFVGSSRDTAAKSIEEALKQFIEAQKVASKSGQRIFAFKDWGIFETCRLYEIKVSN